MLGLDVLPGIDATTQTNHIACPSVCVGKQQGAGGFARQWNGGAGCRPCRLPIRTDPVGACRGRSYRPQKDERESNPCWFHAEPFPTNDALDPAEFTKFGQGDG